MRYVLILALLSGLAAFIASHRSLDTTSPSWEENMSFAQSSVAAAMGRLGREDAQSVAAAQSIIQYPVLAGLAATGSVLGLGGLLRLADHLSGS